MARRGYSNRTDCIWDLKVRSQGFQLIRAVFSLDYKKATPSAQAPTSHPYTPLLHMPKTTSSRTRTGRKANVNRSSETLLNRQLRDELWRLRAAGGIAKPRMPTFLRNGGLKVKTDLYLGSSHKVYGPAHPKFEELGRVYFSSGGGTHFPDFQEDIPLSLLRGSVSLRQLLLHRAVVKGWSTPDSQPAVPEAASAGGLVSDDEIEFVDSGHVNSDDTVADDSESLEVNYDSDIAIVAYRPVYTVKVHVWVKNTPGHVFTVMARPNNDYKLTLYSMKSKLGEVAIENGDAVECRLHGRGAKFEKQPWGQPFVVRQGESLDLRLQG
ncbi:hypothetical protein V5O48_014785 [Marasmius crinis-equi]|uniref:Uncharacterized protein n=1 Tax=Marasmius crinis-equi TaxID=585013 RepID=A0ABR3EWN1_9AGAR